MQTLRNTGLRANHGSIVDLDVANDPRLTSNHNPGANPHTARDPNLRDDNGMFPNDHVVRDLDQVIDFHAFLNPGASKARPIDRRIRADLDIVIDLHDTDLRNFLMSTGLISKPKPSEPMTTPLWMITRFAIRVRSRTVTFG